MIRDPKDRAASLPDIPDLTSSQKRDASKAQELFDTFVASRSPVKEQCCERDNDRDGNCDVHASRGVLRSEYSANVRRSSRRDASTEYPLLQAQMNLEAAAHNMEECHVYERFFGKLHPGVEMREKQLRCAAVTYTAMLAISLGGFDGC